MKPRLLLLITVFLLAGAGLHARQPDSLQTATGADSTTSRQLGAIARTVDTIQQRQAAMTAQQQFLDSATRAAIDSSFSRALANARRHPEQLYEQKTSGFLSVVSYILLVLFLFFSFYYFFTTALCRNESYGDNCELKPIKLRPFSYARVQLFWWTVIILFCYIWFYAAYNVLLPVNPTVVILLGSGLAVYIFGKTIDNSQIEKNNRHEPTRHQDINDSQGFLTDILTDDNGISIHRMQAVAFNIIFGIGFIGYFFTSAATKHIYPFIDFEPWQFSLLGVSAVGYLGMKANENSPSTISNRRALKKDNPGGTATSTNTVTANNANAAGATEVPATRQIGTEA